MNTQKTKDNLLMRLANYTWEGCETHLQDECVEILNQVVCEYEHMWTKTLGEMTASDLAASRSSLRLKSTSRFFGVGLSDLVNTKD